MIHITAIIITTPAEVITADLTAVAITVEVMAAEVEAIINFDF